MRPEKPRLLLADDETAITANLAPFLERSGFQVSVVSDGQKAFERACELPFELIVLDIMMPLMDGREVLRALRRMGKLTPVILLTQVGSSTERALALEEGADDYLKSPLIRMNCWRASALCCAGCTPDSPPWLRPGSCSAATWFSTAARGASAWMANR